MSKYERTKFNYSGEQNPFPPLKLWLITIKLPLWGALASKTSFKIFRQICSGNPGLSRIIGPPKLLLPTARIVPALKLLTLSILNRCYRRKTGASPSKVGKIVTGQISVKSTIPIWWNLCLITISIHTFLTLMCPYIQEWAGERENSGGPSMRELWSSFNQKWVKTSISDLTAMFQTSTFWSQMKMCMSMIEWQNRISPQNNFKTSLDKRQKISITTFKRIAILL